LASDVEFKKRAAGLEALEPVGFPVEDVFIFAATIELKAGDVNWGKLKRWRWSRLSAVP